MDNDENDLIKPDPFRDLRRILSYLGAERVRLLAETLYDICNDTGYGAVEIIIADGRIQIIKVKSYK